MYGKIQSVKYYQYVTDGKTLMDQNEFRLALQKFDNALLLSQKYLFIRDSQLDDFVKSAAK